MTSSLILCLILMAIAGVVLSFDKPVLYEVGTLELRPESNVKKTIWPILTLPKLDLEKSKLNISNKSPRCLCKLPLPIPIPIPIPNQNQFPGVGVNNNVAATQLLSDGRTALYNNMGQIIGYLPAGSTVLNQPGG